LDVIYCLWSRQIKTFVRARGRVISTLIQPFLFLVALGLGFAPVFKRAGEGNYFEFLAPGVIGAGILFNAVFSGSDLLWDRQFGFIKETLVAPVPRSQILIGRALGVTTVALLQAILVGAICAIVGFHYPGLPHVGVAVVFAALVAFLFSLLGSIMGSVLTDTQSFSQIVNFIVSPIFYLSGAVFPLQGQSTIIRTLAFCNPLTYGIDGMRGALTGQHVIDPVTCFAVLIVLSAIALGAATVAFSRIRP